MKRLINPSDEGPVRDKKLDEVVAALVELKLTAGLQKVKKMLLKFWKFGSSGNKLSSRVYWSLLMVYHNTETSHEWFALDSRLL